MSSLRSIPASSPGVEACSERRRRVAAPRRSGARYRLAVHEGRAIPTPTDVWRAPRFRSNHLRHTVEWAGILAVRQPNSLLVDYGAVPTSLPARFHVTPFQTVHAAFPHTA